MSKRKIRSVESDRIEVKPQRKSEKGETMERLPKKLRKTDRISEDSESGTYVRLKNKPSVSSKVKKIKKVKKSKKVTPEFGENLSVSESKHIQIKNKSKQTELKKLRKIKLDNEDECTKLLKALNFDKSSVLSGINALFKVLEQKKENDNQLLDLDTPIFLQLTSIKVPICPSRTVRLPLKHSLHDEDCTVCFIVSDVKGINRKEHEKAVEHYEKLFADKGVETKIHKILPYHELKTEYGEFEMKRKLLSTYDVFFVDGRISKYVSKHLGKIFRTKRRLPIPIILERGMATRMKYAMLRTSMNLHGRGNTYTVQIGHCNMSTQQIYDNILSVCTKLIREFPGGWENVKVVNLKTDLSMAIPLYLSLKNPSEIEVPRVKGRRPKAFKPCTDELSTRLNKKVTVFPTGYVIVEDISPPEGQNSEDDDDE